MSSSDARRLVAQRFSDAARGYATHAAIQTTLAEDLVGHMSFLETARVLDVGAGDGAAAAALVRGGADVVALDAAWGMVAHGRRQCPEAVWVQADACAMPFERGSFDAVVSSSVYQWVDDLPCAFTEARRVLRPDGHFAAALFGSATLQEFFASLDHAARSLNRDLPSLRRMPSDALVRQALDIALFENATVAIESRVALFQDLKALLKWLQGIGANGLARDFFWGKALLASTEKAYRKDFSRGDKLQATFEIIWVEAKA
jgi:malonyl-CoA O-methyltransferase